MCVRKIKIHFRLSLFN